MFLRLFCALFVISCFICCNTPYTGDLGPEDFNGWIESESEDFVCLNNGFDQLCVRTITGPQGPKGDNGNTGKVGPQGPKGDKGDKGRMGRPGIRGREGPEGPQGDKGEKGDQGVAGAIITKEICTDCGNTIVEVQASVVSAGYKVASYDPSPVFPTITPVPTQVYTPPAPPDRNDPTVDIPPTVDEDPPYIFDPLDPPGPDPNAPVVVSTINVHNPIDDVDEPISTCDDYQGSDHKHLIKEDSDIFSSISFGWETQDGCDKWHSHDGYIGVPEREFHNHPK